SFPTRRSSDLLLLRSVSQPATARRSLSLRTVLRYRLAQLERSSSRLVGSSGTKVLCFRRDLLASGLHSAFRGADHLRLRPVLHHCFRWTRMVRLHLPTERFHLGIHVGGKGHRR